MDQADLCYTPATELGRLYRGRALSPVEVADAALARIERLNPTLNAYLTVTADLAREQARAAEGRFLRGEPLGPLDGIPYSLKDLEPTAGIRTTFGSKWFEQHVPSEDGGVARKLRPNGGVLLGKTNTSHWGYKDMCDNLLGPPCANPWNTERTSGASSGGAGSAVAAGLGPLAHGSDGAGSIRIPSALCGIVGLKPTLGLVPQVPSDDWAAIAHSGPMTRTVRDAALLLGAMAGYDERDPYSFPQSPTDYLAACDGDLKGVRVAYSADFGYAAVEPEVRAAAGRAARRFADLGCDVEERDPGWDDPVEHERVLYRVAEAAQSGPYLDDRPDWIEATLKAMIEAGRRYSGVEYRRACIARWGFYQAAVRFFERCDLLLTPQMPLGAWSKQPGPDEGPGQIDGPPAPDMFDRLPFTYPFDLTGQPAISVPCGFTGDGLPIGLQIVGRRFEEALVLRAAAAFEAVQPWAQRRPPLD